MACLKADVAIIGSGFGGSLTALLLERIGLRPILIDRCTHPRFAIGESSTPVADLVLRDLARAYDLPWLAPLAKHGTWQKAYPDLICGLKRGFSYFHHEPRQPFIPQRDHANELLVAASSDDEFADTHWLRSDVDAFLVRKVAETSIPFLDRTEVSVAEVGDGWRLAGSRDGRGVEIRARFLVDASGEGGVVPRALGIANDLTRIATNSRTVYAHFAGVQPWRDYLGSQGARIEDHPFDCDNAALHHLLEEGWMWQLRFRNGVTSAGFMLDAAEHPLGPDVSAADEWRRILQRYPSIAAQFESAQIVQPAGGLRQSGRVQRCAAPIAGPNWALLPNTAGFIDALHSTGIAQTLCGIERLVQLLREHWEQPSLNGELQRYGETVRQEIAFVDRLVSGCYRARRRFRLFAAFAMLYFAAATTYEHRRRSGSLPPASAFLCANDQALVRAVDLQWRELNRLVGLGRVSEAAIDAFEASVAEAIRPFNRVGLCDPAAQNMYRYTAAPSG